MKKPHTTREYPKFSIEYFKSKSDSTESYHADVELNTNKVDSNSYFNIYDYFFLKALTTKYYF